MYIYLYKYVYMYMYLSIQFYTYGCGSSHWEPQYLDCFFGPYLYISGLAPAGYHQPSCSYHAIDPRHRGPAGFPTTGCVNGISIEKN